VHYGPHEKSVMHSHPNAVAVYLTNGTMVFHFPDGKSQMVRKLPFVSHSFPEVALVVQFPQGNFKK
jgi:hypothetical protein